MLLSNRRVVDALFELVEAMIGGVKRIFRVSCLMATPLDIAWFLETQESDDELVNCVIPIGVCMTSIIAKISIQGLFLRDLEVSVDHIGKL